MYRTAEAVSAALWKQFLYSSQLVVIVLSAMTLRLCYLGIPPTPSITMVVEIAMWRLALLTSFQAAPLAWALFLYQGYRQKLLKIPLYESMKLLRLPLATWVTGCLLTGTITWSILSF